MNQHDDHDAHDLGELVARSARLVPDALAVSGPGGALTYRELDRAADVLAARLRARGVGGGDRVVIWLDKSVAAVVAMQALLRLAAVYVPVDGTNPAPRAGLIARDCAAALVITDPARAAALGDGPERYVLDGVPAVEGPVARVAEPVAADDLAYILYTSGSTGEPKGVGITHRNALAFVRWAAAELGATARDRFANHASFGFDLSVLDLYAAFLAGASVHLIPAQMAYAPAQLVDFVVRERITIWYSVPSVLVLMIRDGGLCATSPPAELRALLFAGEPFPMQYLTRLYAHWPGIRFLNLYGPTETNVCTFHEVTAADVASGRPLPIGRASSGDDVWAIRDDGGRAEPGEVGELVVAGPTVMAGYWGREPQHGPYHTGDLVRVRAPGCFDYVGRRDSMVKIRGHRVELGEIEAVLAGEPRIDEVAVVITGEGTAARLVAFVVPAGRPPGLLALKRWCAERLPPYMVVDSLVVVPELPRTGNGKTDRRRLAAEFARPLAGATPQKGS
ncbi:MAG TPA: amino acid adenylation domain-containing protein [Streptosporangiaceae bacterium]